MINFRYHVVSLIAVFLALAIGVIMGSAVIDRAIVDRLEQQQDDLELDIGEVERENDRLAAENRDLRETAEQLAEEGSQRLLAGTLAQVPVVVVATRGVESKGFDDLLALLAASGADRRGTIWLTERFALDDEDEQRDLAEALDAPPTLSVSGLRTLALTRLSTMMREEAAPGAEQLEPPPEPVPAEPEAPATPAATVLDALVAARFVDVDVPEGQSDGGGLDLPPGTRVVLVAGDAGDVPVEDVAARLADLLVTDREGIPPMAVVAAEHRVPGEEPSADFAVALRQDDDLDDRLSTVDNIGDFAGRLAVVLAIVDLGDGRTGHYGRGAGADRLLPAPPET